MTLKEQEASEAAEAASIDFSQRLREQARTNQRNTAIVFGGGDRGDAPTSHLARANAEHEAALASGDPTAIAAADHRLNAEIEVSRLRRAQPDQGPVADFDAGARGAALPPEDFSAQLRADRADALQRR